MKFFNKYIVAALFASVGLVGCDEDVTIDTATNGEANFSNYVALGDSLTAGYADGALYSSAQSNSYPALIASQFANAGGGNFNQPMVSDDNGGLLLGGQPIAAPKLVLGASGPQPVSAAPSTEVGANISGQGPYNNLGVPGAKSYHLLFDGYGSLANLRTGQANPYYVRFSKPNTSIIADAVSQTPTFYTLWIGNNDVLGYATSGGSSDSITPVASFTQYIGALLQNLNTTGAKGVVANIPNITEIPFFTTVPNKPIPLDGATATGVNNSYAAYNGAIAQYNQYGLVSDDELAKRTIQFVEGNNAPVIVDNSLTTLRNPRTGQYIPKLRQLEEGELIVLKASSVIGTLADPSNPRSVIGVAVPLGGEYVLTADEISAIQTATAGYNTAIENTAAQLSIPVVDMKDYFADTAESGIRYSGADYSVKYVTGGLFSLDGVHPTQKGYAVIANKFIETINNNYSANVPMVDVSAYPGVALP